MHPSTTPLASSWTLWATPAKCSLQLVTCSHGLLGPLRFFPVFLELQVHAEHASRNGEHGSRGFYSLAIFTASQGLKECPTNLPMLRVAPWA